MGSPTPFLWFESRAVEAAQFYVSLFPNSAILEIDSMSARFSLGGQEYIAFNGGPAFSPSPAFSMMVDCDSQRELDAWWDRLLSGGGRESRCGWLVDRFGLSWQVVPRQVLAETIGHPDSERSQRAIAALMSMTKLDIDTLRAAADGRYQENGHPS